MQDTPVTSVEEPQILPLGADGIVVRFASRLEDAANRAALALAAAVSGWDEAVETVPSLASVLIRFDPAATRRQDLAARLAALLGSRDWHDAALPAGRRLWHVPTYLRRRGRAATGRSRGAGGPQPPACGGRTDRPAAAHPRHRLRPRTALSGAVARPVEPAAAVGADAAGAGRRAGGGDPPTGAVRRRGADRLASGRPLRLSLLPARIQPEPFPLHPGDELHFHPIPAVEWDAVQADPDGGARVEALA